MSHPSLGLPPADLRAGFPEAAARLRENARRIGTRGLEIALDRDPAMAERRGELDRRLLLRDTEVLIEELALSVASNDPRPLREFADHLSVPYRRRRWTMDDAIALLEGIRFAARSVLGGDEVASADTAIDAAIERLLWHRRLAGDMRKRNPILAALYKGA